jgi:DNA polymerase V
MNRGGKRQGAGRPKGRNLYGEATKPIRIPVSRIGDVITLLAQSHSFSLPLYANTVQAGFPSPADDYIEQKLDLNTHLIKHPAATFFVTARGDSMKNAGIQSGDMLIVDRSLEATHGRIIIAALNGELTVKRLAVLGNQVKLMAENPAYDPIDITNDIDLVVWGVVTHVIHQVH